ncbi:hypothetical protein [Aeromonas hydrophila]|uniref:hypothetical protein n=1 Tax=Aeromonas hydrophila TaxID=644 RepID=UPI001967BCE9|nr:hypothetical protein [Aeromonas hydrophila]
MKISAGSAGTAIAGVLIEKDMKIPIIAGIILVVTGAVVAWSSSAKKKIFQHSQHHTNNVINITN